MRTAGRIGRTVVLRMRFGDYSRATRSTTLQRPTATTAVVLAALRSLLGGQRETIQERGLTLIGVSITNLRPAAGRQLELPFDDRGRAALLDAVVDEVCDRFGAAALRRAVLLRAREPSVWLSPDDVTPPVNRS